MSQWLDAVVTELKSPNTSTELLAFVEGNYTLFDSLGFDTFSEVVNLFKEGQPSQAVLALEAKLGPAEIIQQENKVAADIKTATAAFEQFKSDLESFALALAPVVLKVGIGIVSGGTLL
jgi:hypothetical protein